MCCGRRNPEQIPQILRLTHLQDQQEERAGRGGYWVETEAGDRHITEV